MLPVWLTKAAAARRLGVSVTTINRRLAAGELHGQRVHGQWQINAAEVDQLAGRTSLMQQEYIQQLAEQSRRAMEIAQEAMRRVRQLERRFHVATDSFGSRRQIAEYIARHGPKIGTTKGWQELDQFINTVNPRTILDFLVRRKHELGFRAKWPIHKCDVEDCACHIFSDEELPAADVRKE